MQQNKSESSATQMQIDSGADGSVTNNKHQLTNFKQYEFPKIMYTITGSQIRILGEGRLGKLLDRIYYSPDADSAVIAVKDLQMRNLLTYFPPGRGSGCTVIDPKTNKIVFTTDEQYMITVQNYGGDSSNNADNNNVNETKILEGGKVRTVKSHLTLDEKKLSFLIPDMQRRLGYRSLDAMLGIARSTDGFLFTPKQIRKFFVQFPQYHMGRSCRSSFTLGSTTRKQPIKIGSVVSTDCMEINGGGCGFVRRPTLFG